MRLVLAVALGLALTSGGALAADATDRTGDEDLMCADSGAITDGKFIDDLCWDCLWPIRLAGMGTDDDKFPSDTAAPICVCPSKSLFGFPTPGLTAGMWKPTHFVETVRKPGCFSALGQETDLGGVQGIEMGGRAVDNKDSGFRNTHLYVFPTGMILDMLVESVCTQESSDLDLVMLSEIDPTYSDPELSMVVNPEANLFNNEIATAACMVDAVASTAKRPIDQLFWCLGSWGNVYPLSGYNNARSSVQDISLTGARLVAMQHKRMLMQKTYGNGAVCAAQTYFRYPKHQYRWQILFPKPQEDSNDWTGSSTMVDREWRQETIGGGDWVQVLWRYEECCVHIQ